MLKEGELYPSITMTCFAEIILPLGHFPVLWMPQKIGVSSSSGFVDQIKNVGQIKGVVLNDVLSDFSNLIDR